MNEKCYCSDRHTIVIDRRSASRVTSCLALGALFVFVTGYFMGKRSAFQEDIENQELSLFAHRIQYALNDQGSEQLAQDSSAEEQHPEPEEVVPHITAQTEHVCEDTPEDTTKQYVALIAGYGTQKAAQQLVKNLEKKGITLEVKTRVSTSAQKKSRTWYQVVTQKYANRQELASLTTLIRDLAHLTEDPKILELT